VRNCGIIVATMFKFNISRCASSWNRLRQYQSYCSEL